MSKQGFKIITLLAGMLLLFNFGFSQPSDDSLAQLIKNGAFLVDVRFPAEFAEGHVPGSVNIPLSEVEKELAQFKGKDQIVVFCKSGGRSTQAMNILNSHGFDNVTNGLTWKNVNQYVEK